MSYNYPAPGNYGQQLNSGQPYAPQSHQPPPGAYSAPPPPGLGPPQPPGSYGIPPSGQYGAPPAPGQYGAQYGIQAPPYGTPPPAQYAPHAQYGAPGQMIGGPPRYDGSHSQGAPSQTPQPQPSITFRVTEPGKGILNSEVVDPWGRTGWSVSSPSKKQTFIRNQGGDVVGRIEWHTWASSRLDFLGYHGKVKEFIPRGQRKYTRVIQYDEVDYDVVEDKESGTIRIRLDPGATYAIIRGSTEIEITPAGRSLGSEFVDYVLLVAVCYRSGHSFGDTDNQVGLWAAEGAAAASYT